MTLNNKNLPSGLPPPITELTVAQDLKMRQLELSLNSGKAQLKDIITVFLALQKQNFVLCNSLTNLVNKWPKDRPITKEDLTMFGILLETKD
ncbi:hypothetical protein CMK18_23760 [Candidatus Poribacteria bacterium]|nr:hypothetical protein [Candidatus Poribacteria bacterium]